MLILRQIGLLALAIVCAVAPLSAVIIEVREYHGKQVTCIHSGLRGTAKSCGSDGYTRVFTGIVRSAVDKGDTDKLLEIVPDEVFTGDSTDATVITNQACLRKDIESGEKWLFYLYRDPKSNALVLGYDTPSKPISEADDDLSLLRDLGQLENGGVLIGTVYNLGETEQAKSAPLGNHTVIAKNVKSGTAYSTLTNERGYFKFELPAGEYDVTTAPEYGLAEVEAPLLSMKGSVPVQNGRCWQRDFAVRPVTAIKPNIDGIISGHVGSPDGKPFTVHPWVQIVALDSGAYKSACVDAKGNFEAKDVKPGRYVVGLGIKRGTGYFSEVPTPVYYPGVRTKEEAIIIDLGPRETRGNVDFQLPPEDVLKPLLPLRPAPAAKPNP